jgi:glucosylceramidase
MNRVLASITAICLAMSVGLCAAAAKHDTLIVSGKGSYWQPGTITTGTGTATVTVNESQPKQKWIGFGGCFNEKGWEALQNLSASDRSKAMKLLFDKKDGLGLEWGRIPIGASDYGLTRYTLDETPGDTGMEHFSIAHDTNYLIPFIKAAQAVKPDIQFWASAWTPPTWMKTGATDAGGYDGGVFRNEAKYLKANALYTAKFIEAYKAKGIPIKFVVPQNEPGYDQNYPSCGWGKYRKADGTKVYTDPEFLSDYIVTYLMPTMQTRTPETDVWFGNLSNNECDTAYWSATKPKLGSHVIKGMCLQWNMVFIAQNLANSGYLVMQSEQQCGNYPWKDTMKVIANADSSNFFPYYAPNNHNYGQESWSLIKNWLKNGVHSYCAWNMVLDTGGFNLDQSRKWPQNSLLAVNYASKTLKVTPYYYVFRHLAQFVDTGAVYLTTQGGDAIAFRNPDSSIVTAVFNPTNSAATTTVSVRSKSYQFSVPAIGWATLCVGLKPPTLVNDISQNQFSRDASGLMVTCKGNEYRIALPSREAGRIELLTVTGRVLESRSIPQGSREMLLQKQASHAGLLLVRVVYGGEAKISRLFAAH